MEIYYFMHIWGKSEQRMCSVNTIGENVTGNNMKERDTNEERKESADALNCGE